LVHLLPNAAHARADRGMSCLKAQDQRRRLQGYRIQQAQASALSDNTTCETFDQVAAICTDSA